jgi:ABC-type glycerol-3-phosphate transport system substrate-binding protein
MLEIARRAVSRKPDENESDSTWGLYHNWQGVLHFPYAWIRGNGGEPLVPVESPNRAQWSTDAETVNTVQWLVDLIYRFGVMPVLLNAGPWGSFLDGHCAMVAVETNNLARAAGNSTTPAVPFRWDVHHFPMMKKGRYYPINAFSYGLSRSSGNSDVAWELLKQIIGPDGQTDWFKLAQLAPSLKPLLDGAYLQDTQPPTSKKVVVESLLAARSMPRSPHMVDIGTIVSEVFKRAACASSSPAPTGSWAPTSLPA